MLGLYKDPGLITAFSTSGLTCPDLSTGLAEAGFVLQEPVYVANLGGSALAAPQITSYSPNPDVSILYALDGNDMPGAYSSTLTLTALGAYGSGTHIVKVWRKITMLGSTNIAETRTKHLLKTSSADSNPVMVDTKQVLWSCCLFDGVDLGALGCTLTSETSIEVLPDRKIRTVSIKGRHGSIITGSRMGIRKLDLVLHLEASSYFNLLSLEDTLTDMFNPLGGFKDLILEWDPLSVYKVKYAGNSAVKEWIKDGRVDISLKTKDPYIYSTEKVKAGVGTIRNEGTFPTPLVITIAGPASNPAISVGDEEISYTGAIASGSSLIIDGENYLVTMGGVNVLALLEGDIPSLPAGIVTVGCTSGSISWKWKERRIV